MSFLKNKPVVAIDLSTKGEGGGPHTSTNRIISSELKENFEFRIIYYNVELGRGISWARIKDLKNQIKAINPDIVHFTGLQLTGLHVAIACKLAGIKNSVITIRGMSGDSVFFSGSKKVILKYIIEPLTLLLTKKFYCVSEYVASRRIAKIFGWKSLGAIYNYPFHSIERYERKNIRAKYGFSEDDLVVVSIARINKEKGYHVLEKSIENLKEYKNIKFLIAGDGDYLDTMKKKLSKQIQSGKVIFLGHTKEVQKINNCGDIFVLPTLHETLSIALLEASQAKLALIGSNVGGVPEIIEHGYNGYLVEPNDSRMISHSILKLYNNPALRACYSENAYKKVMEKFSSEDISNKIREVYSSLLR